jgi:tetratricopeptide (TPR) repeat protein
VFKRSIVVSLLLVAVPLVSQQTNDPEALKNLGRAALAEGNADKAVELLQKAVELRPNSAEYHYRLGQALGAAAMKASFFSQASLAGKTRDEFLKAVQLDPNYLDARNALVDYYTMAPALVGGSEEKAMEQAAELKKRDALLGHRAYARIYTRAKKLDLARKEWQDFVREQPQSAAAHSLLGSFLGMTDKKPKEGFEEVDLAIKLDPSYMPAYYRLGAIAATTGARLPRGEEALKKYVSYKPAENEPSLANAHYFLGMVYEKEGKKAEAKTSYANALRLAPGSKEISEALKRVS